MQADATPGGPGTVLPPSEGAKWIPTIGVFLVIAFVVLGGYVVAGESQEFDVGQDSVPGEPVQVTDGVTVTPPEGWEVTQRYADPPGVLLTWGTGNLLVVVPAIDATPEELLQVYLDQVLEPQATQVSVSTKRLDLVLPYGEAVRTSYVGQFEGVASTIEGELTAAVSPGGTDVMFDSWSSQGQYVAVRQDVRQVVAGTEVGS
ncbi:MAG: hypothetical protein ACRDH8_11000 [Actinomycetota bacterium]